MKLPRSTLYRLAKVTRLLHALRNPKDDKCCIDPKVKEAVGSYLDTHVLPELHQILHEAVHNVPVVPFRAIGWSDCKSAAPVLQWIKSMDPAKQIPMHLDMPPKGEA